MIKKMIENKLRSFEHVESKLIDSIIKRVCQIKRNQTTRDRGRPRKIIGLTINKNIEINNLDKNRILYKKLWQNFIYIIDHI